MPRVRRKIRGRKGYRAGHIEQLKLGNATGDCFGKCAESKHLVVSVKNSLAKEAGLILRWYSKEQWVSMRKAWCELAERVTAELQDTWGPDALPWAYFAFDASKAELKELNSRCDVSNVSSLSPIWDRTTTRFCTRIDNAKPCNERCSLWEYCKQRERNLAFRIHWALHARRKMVRTNV